MSRVEFLGGVSGDAVSGLVFVRADKDADGDFDPLTAAAWENSTKSGSGTINWNTVFGVPEDAKVVSISVIGRDGNADTEFKIRTKITTTKAALYFRTQVANIYVTGNLAHLPIAADGTSYYIFGATWDDFYLRVVGWYV